MKLFLSPISKALAVLTLCVGGFLLVSAQGTSYPLPDIDYPLFGYACNPTTNTVIGCVSLNKASSAGQAGFTGQPDFVVTYNPAKGKLGGQGYNPLVGKIDFGVQCPVSMDTDIPYASQGLKCAKILNFAGSTSAGNGWNEFIFIGSVSWRPTSSNDRIVNNIPQNPNLIGTVWQGINTESVTAPYAPDVGIGRLDFGQSAFIKIEGCTTMTDNSRDPYATVHVQSMCTSTTNSCNTSIPTTGCPEVCQPLDNIDNDNDGLTDCQDSDCSSYAACQIQCVAGVPKTGCPEICANGVDDNNNGTVDEATCTGGTGTGAIIPKYKER